MKKSRFTDEQIAFALKQAETGTRIDEICRKMGISDATFYKWLHVHKGASLSSVSCSRLLLSIRGTNCLRKLLRLRGHRRVPEPPQRTTGMIFIAPILLV